MLLGVTLAVVGALWLAMALLMPSDEELAARAATELESLLGVKVSIGALHWQLLPALALVIENAATGQPEPIVVKRLTAYLDVSDLHALLQHRVKISRAEVEGAVLPQLSLRGLGPAGDAGVLAVPGAEGAPGPGRPKTAENNNGGFRTAEVPLTRLVFRDVTWISRYGVAVVYEGEADFEDGWRPRQAQLRRPEVKPVTNLGLTRQGDEERWLVRINAGGGTADGEVQLKTGASGALQLSGKLQPKGIEVASTLAAFNRRAVLVGKMSGHTTLSASGATVAGLAQSLHTQTTFAMSGATLLRFDLDKAIRSAGKEHSGQTPLDAVTGQLDTQNTAQGMVVDFTNLKAKSGALSASGQAHLAKRQVSAEFTVDLVGGLVGVPLQLSGPVNQVKVSVPGGAVAGAILGTAVLPGVGTALGARLGAAIGKIFSPAPAAPSSTAPAAKRPERP